MIYAQIDTMSDYRYRADCFNIALRHGHRSVAAAMHSMSCDGVGVDTIAQRFGVKKIVVERTLSRCGL